MRLLGIKGVRDGKALSALLESDKGTLDHLGDGRLRHLVSTLPPRMDLGHGIPLWAAFPGFEGHALDERDTPHDLAVRRDRRSQGRRHAQRGGAAEETAPLNACGSSPTWAPSRPPLNPSERSSPTATRSASSFTSRLPATCASASRSTPRSPGCAARVQLAEVTLLAIVRVKLQPLVPRIPIVAGTAVSFVGDALVDAALRLELPLMPGMDLGCLPGWTWRRNLCTRLASLDVRYPSWLYSPVLDFDHPAVKQLTRGGGGGDRDGEHVVTVKVKQARSWTPPTAGTATRSPSSSRRGEADYASRAERTDVKKRTLKPTWDQTFSFSAADADVLMVAVFDLDAKPTAKAIDPARLLA